MRTITVFELQRNIGKQLEELPFQITKYGKVIAVVNKYNVTLNDDNVTLNTSATKLNEAKIIKEVKDVSKMISAGKKVNLCQHGSMVGLCRFGCK